MTTRTLSVLEAVREALAEEMERDPRVVLLGEDIGRLGGVFRASHGLLDRFGPERVIDTPMAETAIAGITMGLAMRGLRPVAEIQFADFMHSAMDHLAGEAAKLRYRTGGDWTAPLVVRTAYGGGFRGGPYHSQSVEAFYSHVPGLKVMAPSFPDDAKGMLTAAIRDPDPVLFLEHKRTYRAITGPVPAGEHVVADGRLRVARAGDALTIVGWGMMLHEALAAADELAAEGIEVEVLDLRWLLPIDRDGLLDSLRRTGRLLVVHEDTLTMGLGAELCALAAEAGVLSVPPVRVAMPDVGAIPVADAMEDALIPTRHKVVAAARNLMEKGDSSPLRGEVRPGGPGWGTSFDTTIPEASSVIEVTLPEVHLELVLAALQEACRAVPQCNATFTWDGIRLHDQVHVDLDLGPLSPARGGGTFTLVDYGPGGSLLGLPAVRPGQTAALRVGAVREGRAYLALAVDHRAVDGADAGRFLQALRQALPER
ncbi:MAG TPA: transketolase C-terminal domain-containing protein [Candidatus Dormibacteraeota bacterium]